MKIHRSFLLEATILLVLSLLVIGIGTSKAGVEDNQEESSNNLAQITNLPTDATVTYSPITPTVVSSTIVISATLTLEPFSTVAIIFPELPYSATPSPTMATKEPVKGIPLPYITSNKPQSWNGSLLNVVIFFWLVLIVFTIFVARKIFQLWIQ